MSMNKGNGHILKHLQYAKEYIGYLTYIISLNILNNLIRKSFIFPSYSGENEHSEKFSKSRVTKC